MTTLEQSYAYCRAVARAKARNFYYSFLLLPPDKRAAMCAIYAFMRECDDISDEPNPRGAAGAREALREWGAQLDRALSGDIDGHHPLWPAFAHTARRYRIPSQYFHDMLAGVGSDMEPRTIANFEELRRYCYLVASVVGMTVIHIFGFEDGRALELAEQCGLAFQLTNIIRDVREDAQNGRIYLPQDQMTAHGISPADLMSASQSENLTNLLRELGEHAKRDYARSLELLKLVSSDSRRSLWALMEIYRRVLLRIEARNYNVLQERIRLSAFEKAGIVAQALLRR